MTPQQAREQVGFALKRAAPGSDIDTIDPDADFRDALELDSLDFLQFVEILSETSGRRIEEDDYPELTTLDGSIRFLTARLPGTRRSSPRLTVGAEMMLRRIRVVDALVEEGGSAWCLSRSFPSTSPTA